MAALRIIKKYPNRRLYDTETSAYITLADVKAEPSLRQPQPHTPLTGRAPTSVRASSSSP